MDYRSLHIKTVVELRKLAKELNVKIPAGTSKSNIIEMILEANARPSEADTVKTETPANNAVPEAPAAPASVDGPEKSCDRNRRGSPLRRRARHGRSSRRVRIRRV